MGRFVVQLEALPDEGLFAEAALERFDAGVFAFVLQLEPLDGEGSLAVAALEGLIAGVVHLVPLAIGVVRKGHRAVPTGIGLLSGVLSHVIPEGILRFAVLGAGFAPEWKRSIVVGVLVRYQLGLLVEPSSARGTDEGFIVGMAALVNLEGVFAREVLLANFARERLLFGVVQLVKGQNVLGAELESTRGTLMVQGLRVPSSVASQQLL